jgi:hypothetical protein
MAQLLFASLNEYHVLNFFSNKQRKLSTIPAHSQVHLLSSTNAQLSHHNLGVVLVRQEQSCPGSTVLNYYLEVSPVRPEHPARDSVQSLEDRGEVGRPHSSDTVVASDASATDESLFVEPVTRSKTGLPTSTQPQRRARRRSISKASNGELESKVIMRRTLLHSRSTTFGGSTTSLVSAKSAKSTKSQSSAASGRTLTADDQMERSGCHRDQAFIRLPSQGRLEGELPTEHADHVDVLRPKPARPDQELTAMDLLRGTRKWTSFTRSRTSSSGTWSGGEGGGSVGQGLGRAIFKRNRSRKQTETSDGHSSRNGSSREIAQGSQQSGVDQVVALA